MSYVRMYELKQIHPNSCGLPVPPPPRAHTHQATVGAIVPGGAADVDGRLQVGDEITLINGLSVVDAPHQNVIGAMGEAAAQGEVVLKIRRKMPLPGLTTLCVF